MLGDDRQHRPAFALSRTATVAGGLVHGYTFKVTPKNFRCCTWAGLFFYERSGQATMLELL